MLEESHDIILFILGTKRIFNRQPKLFEIDQKHVCLC